MQQLTFLLVAFRIIHQLLLMDLRLNTSYYATSEKKAASCEESKYTGDAFSFTFRRQRI
jgi:hypothetical protein